MLLQKVESNSTFCRKSCLFLRVLPAQGKACFAESDANPVYGLTPA